MNIYLLYNSEKGLHLAIGKDCVEAGEALSRKVGGNVDDWSVGGSWEVSEGNTINVGSFWPYFTCTPPKSYTKE